VKQISGLVALAAITLAACSSTGTTAVHGPSSGPAAPTPTTSEQTVAYRYEAPIDAIPWSDVGAGWMLAMWTPATPTKAYGSLPEGTPTPYNSTNTLYLVSPDGGRYPITTFAPDDDGSPQLVDWSGDGSRALFVDSADGEGTVIEVDLHTGAKTSFTVEDGFHVNPQYTLPEGKAILLGRSETTTRPRSLERVDLAGNHQLTYPIEQLGSKFDPDVLSTPDGTRLVLGNEAGGLAVMANDGTLTKTLPVPGQGYCTATRWWDADAATVVASCREVDFGKTQLWLVPIDGGAPTALTAQFDGNQGEILGARSAWSVPGGTYVHAYGPCGYSFLAKLDEFGGLPTKVSVPKVDEHESVDVLGVYQGHLQLQASLSCGDGEALVDYDPAAGKSEVLLGPTVNDGGVIKALPYPGYE
jgi:TolB protein